MLGGITWHSAFVAGKEEKINWSFQTCGSGSYGDSQIL